MLTELCQELRNWFDRDFPKWNGQFKIENHEISCITDSDFNLITGQHFRIIGSLLNDGVYQYPSEELKDEEFTGAVWSMGIPPAVIALAEEIAQWNQDNAAVINSPFTSESFGGYSYSKGGGGGSSSTSGNPLNWKSFFADELHRWRKL